MTRGIFAVVFVACVSACNPTPVANGGGAALVAPAPAPAPGISFVDAGVRQPAVPSSVPAAGSGSVAFTPPPPVTPESKVKFSVACDPTRTVQSDSAALIVRDPAVLARFSLERVLAQIIATSGDSNSPKPKQLLQRLFDTESRTADAAFADNVHCDTVRDGSVQSFVDCPRAEAKLARSEGLLTEGSNDYFAPIALVNRFDLVPDDLTTCGEYRIVYAKSSGKSNPAERVFLSFEAALLNPESKLEACRPIAELWASLATLTASADVADRLEAFFFTGSSGFRPVVHADHFGLNFDNGCSYSGRCGQLRIGQGMMTPWQFRQFRPRTRAFPDQAVASFYFAPTPVTSSPQPKLFESGTSFWRSSCDDHVGTLIDPDVARVRLLTRSEQEAFESAIDGPAQPNFEARALGAASWPELEAWLGQEIARPNLRPLTHMCPSDDPITPVSLLRRATAATCAGCHAPEKLLGPTRELGCASSQPQSLGTVHIDEQGKLSDALTQVYLPHRARVLSTFLQACDAKQVEHNLQAVPVLVIVECLAAGTGIRMADGSERAIEQVLSGDLVLAFDEASSAPVPARVSRAVIRRDARQLIVINGTVAATANHAFHTEHGLRLAEELRVGDRLLSLSSTDARHGEASSPLVALEITELTQRHGQVLTYNIEVDTYHNYFADGLLVSDR